MSDVLILLKEASKIVGLAETTVKGYMNKVEKFSNYRMERSNDGKLVFSDTDINILKSINQLKKIKGITIDEAIKRAISDTLGIADESNISDESTTDLVDMSDVKNALSVVSDISDTLKDMSDKMDTVMTRNDELSTQNKAMVNQIEALKSEQLRESMEQKKLMIEVREMLKAQQELAASQEKRGFWARVFRK